MRRGEMRRDEMRRDEMRRDDKTARRGKPGRAGQEKTKDKKRQCK